MHRYEDLIDIFNGCFLKTHNTRLVKGLDEPLYLPQDETRPCHEIHFARGFFASALHEVAHWLIAGEKRRKLVDFGYWYAPDGRSREEQELFQKVEVKPQAMEWILSKASGACFRLSIDNLSGEEADTNEFKNAIYEQIKIYCEEGLSVRAQRFREALCSFYGTSNILRFEDFDLKSL
jgi:elongation factor P hydroxylase